MKIGDLWVKLGLKKDDLSKGVKEAKGELSGFGNGLKSIATKGTVAFAAVAAAVIGVVAAVKDLGKQNQTLGDEIAKTGAGLSAMWDSIKTAIASMDFSHIISNLVEVNNLARDLYDAMDAMGEITTSYNIALSEQLPTINRLKLALRDANLTDQERLDAGKQLLEIYRNLEKNPTRGLNRVMNATIDKYMQKMGVNMKNRTDKELEAMRNKYVKFFKWLGTTQGENFTNAAQTVVKSGGLDSYWGKTYLANAKKAGMEEYARLAYGYVQKMGDKDRLEVEKAVVAYRQQENKAADETFRIQTQINAIRAQQKDEPDGPADKMAETAYKTLQRAKDSAKSELQLLTEKYDAEKALLEKYGLDTTALWDEYTRNMKKLLDVNLKDMKVEIDLEVDDIDMSSVDEEIQANIDKILEEMKRVQDVLDMYRESVAEGITDAVQELADQIAGLENVNAGRAVQALLEPLANMAQREGEILIAEGVGIEACKKALESLNGYAAIAAGAALVAIGAAAKSGLAALAGNGGRSTTASTYSGGTGTGNGGQQLQAEMTVYVKGTIKGSDIVLSGQKTVNNWRR